MAIDAQAVIQAIVRALEEPPTRARQARKPVITISRTLGSGGDVIARAVSERMGIELYGSEIITAIATEANVSSTLIEALNEKLDAVDAWIYSAVFGKHVSRDEYVHFLSTVIRGLYHTGGVIIGRGGHVILAGRDVLRVRIVGSVEACATRISEDEGISYAEAKRKVQDNNKRRGKFIWDLFHSRYNDPTNFDMIVNTDYFRKFDDVVEMIVMAARARGLDRKLHSTQVAAGQTVA
ncbi:MAG: cytidylate kinase-like family protein [Defluviicoccus sp.]|nr:cytidylate kinase-like family protein [Defluviicoccus sp.]MDG4591360.1 cytidylate kinase-like family protein [Defluviicoccus sp.]MDS4012239.1 cytidylate kinase-like family protein [Defluviicoccus sp.]MDS4071612.1 cytidylate kinase-like family protein [Defluviicoccus sp.]